MDDTVDCGLRQRQESDEEMAEATDTIENLEGGRNILGNSNESGVNNGVTNNNGVNTEGDTIDIVVPLFLPQRQMEVSEASSSSSTGDESSDSKKIREMLAKISRLMTSKKRPYASCEPDAIYYNMGHLRRGKAIIFNHFRFDPKQGLGQRDGTNVDLAALEKTFQGLGFTVEIHNDLTFKRIDAVLQKAADDDHSDEDCIAVIVMTHGKNQNKLNAYDHDYTADIIWRRFTADKCSSLAGKPKMFFIQACRGDQYDDGTELQSRKSRTVVDGPGRNNSDSYKIPNQADFLTVFSTAPALMTSKSKSRPSFLTRMFHYLSISNSGYYSWRSSSKGSCFIQALCKMLDTWADCVDVLSLVTMVNNEVAMNYESNVFRDLTQHGKKQVPHVSHTLTRQIRFFPTSAVGGLGGTLV